MPKWSEFFFGKPDKEQKMSTVTPEQQAFMNMMLQMGGQGMGQGFDYFSQIMSDDPSATEAFEAPYLRQFQEQTIPNIAEQFSALDAQGSSAFGQTLSSAGAGLQENLAALRQGLKMQAMQQMQGMAGMGMGQQWENIFRPATPGFFDMFAQGLGKGVGEAGTAAVMG
jgi:hypothetical protein